VFEIAKLVCIRSHYKVAGNDLPFGLTGTSRVSEPVRFVDSQASNQYSRLQSGGL
jgi:hypothetical protein